MHVSSVSVSLSLSLFLNKREREQDSYTSPSIYRFKYLPFSQTMTRGSEYQTCMIKAPPPPSPLQKTRKENTLVEPASGLEQPRLRPPCRSVPPGAFKQIPLVTFFLARCEQVLRQMFPPFPQYWPSFSFSVTHVITRPLFSFPSPSWPLICLKKKKQTKKKISYLHSHCQVSTQDNPNLP